MATPIVPKSEMRINHNIIVGFGEVPAVEIEGRIGWGLPEGQVIFEEEEARAFAAVLDQTIRANLKSPKNLLH